jgi:ribosomal protein L17
MGVVVLYQETTAMKIINDTDTGTAQRFLWFSGHSPSAPATGAPPAYRMVAPRVTALPREELPDGTNSYVLCVEPAITARLRAEDAAKRDAYSLGDANRDSQKPAVVAKVAALACLIEGRSLVTQDDWDLGEELYAASRAVQDELIELAEEQDRAKRREAAARAGESDHIRKTFVAVVVKVAGTIVRKGIKIGHPMSRREITQSVTPKKRAYILEALDLAVDNGWLDADGEKYKVGSVPLPDDM